MTVIVFDNTMDAVWFRRVLTRRAAVAREAGESAHAGNLLGLWRRVRAEGCRTQIDLSPSEAVTVYSALYASMIIDDLTESCTGTGVADRERRRALTDRIREAI